jgi:alpha-amylase
MHMYRPLVLLLFVVLASCAAQQTAAPAPAANEAAVTPTTAAPPTATLDLPTPPPKITPGPTAAPFALETGWWEGAVCYEIFVRSFYDSNGDGIGDLNGVIEKLDYVNDGNPASRGDLGANCIWLMPVTESTSYHGYDVVDYYSIEADYGTNDDFKRLVAEAEARGIKIVVDLVLNHTSRDHPWFKEAASDRNSPYRDWYLWSNDKPRYKGPWSQEVWHASPGLDEYYYGVFWEGMPDLNYRNPAVFEEVKKISLFWLEEMNVAGFRMDAIKHMIENGPAQEDTVETFNWLRQYREFMQAEAPGKLTIGEIFGGDPILLKNYYPDQMDYYFEFKIAESARGAANFGLASAYLKAVDAAQNQLPFQRYATFLTNHDQNRVMSELGDDVSKARMAALALLTLPGMPFVYYGEEIGMLGVKPDERIRTPMQWAGDEKGGFTTGTPWQTFQKDVATKNVAAQADDPDSLLSLYRELIHLHVATPALANGDFIPLESSSGSVAGFLRRADDELALVVLNFSKDPAENVSFTLAASDLPAGEYTLTTLYGEGNATALTVGEGGTIAAYTPLASLPARSGFIFGNE